MTAALGSAIGLLIATAVFAVIRIIAGPDDASRAVVADLVYFCVIAAFILVGTLSGSMVVFEVALLASLIGILATVALARLLTRGKR